jgi:elongation factor Ts
METSQVSSFTAQDVMKLRQRTGLGMMDCKEALAANQGDPAKAEEWLRAKLKGKMDTRTERATAQGRVAVAIQGSKAAVVEVQTETDFTANNETFVQMADAVAKAALKMPAGEVTPSDEMNKFVDPVRITTGENMRIARGDVLEGGTFGSYVHHDGKRAAVVQVEGHADQALLKSICQHIVAHVPPPIAIDQSSVPSDKLDTIRKNAIADAKEAGKNDEIAQKIAEGKVRKYLEEVTLLNQKSVQDDSKTIKDLLPKDVTVKSFVRYTLGAE